MAILLNLPQDTEIHAAGLWSDWKNSAYQLQLLDGLISLPSDTFDPSSLPGRRVNDAVFSKPGLALGANFRNNPWSSLDIIEKLVKLGVSGVSEVKSHARSLLNVAANANAELVHLGLLQIAV